MEFNEETFIYALCSRPADTKRLSTIFKPEWLSNSSYIPLLSEVFEFTKKFGEPPSLETLKKLFQDKNEEAYNLRYKESIEKIQSLGEPDTSEILFTLDKARDYGIIRSFYDLVNSQQFMKKQSDVDGKDLITEVYSWLNKWSETSDNKTMNIKQAIENLITNQGFIPVEKIETGIECIDRWCGGGLKPKNLGIIMAPLGHGKCLKINTPVIMFDGNIKNVQDINSGDLLLGPNGAPREVLATHSGIGQMYKIIPLKGEPFICNEHHILSLRCTTNEGNKYKKGQIYNIELKDYLKQSATYKKMMKLWKTDVEFMERKLAVDPYIVGVYLGDGTRKAETPQVTIGIHKTEIIEYIEKWVKNKGLAINKRKSKDEKDAITFSIVKDEGVSKNWFKEIIEELIDGKGNRIIPRKYLINSRKNRLELLAGLIDTDGSLAYNNYEWITKYEKFANQVAFLARSLGFYVNVNKCKKTIKSTGFEGEYFRLHISGNANEIPCKVSSKKANPRKQIKNILNTAFVVEPIGQDWYYGFELDKDGLFLLGDFTVTHNSTTLSVMAHKIATIQEKRVWFITNELTMDEIAEKFLSRITGISLDKISLDPAVAAKDELNRWWTYKLHERLRLTEVIREISTDELESEMMKWSNLLGWKPDVIILDFMERMKPNSAGFRPDKEWIWLGAISKDLFRMAKRHNMLIWTACQTNRSGLTAKDLNLSMGQGSIRHFQEATAIVALHQEDIPNDDTNVALCFQALKMRHSKKPSSMVALKADLGKMHISNEIITVTEPVDNDQGDDTLTPRQKQRQRKK